MQIEIWVDDETNNGKIRHKLACKPDGFNLSPVSSLDSVNNELYHNFLQFDAGHQIRIEIAFDVESLSKLRACLLTKSDLKIAKEQYLNVRNHFEQVWSDHVGCGFGYFKSFYIVDNTVLIYYYRRMDRTGEIFTDKLPLSMFFGEEK